MRLEGRAVLVTGAAVRVGRAIALAAAREGASVAIHYRSSAAEARETVSRCESFGTGAVAVQADLADHAQVRRMVEEAASRLGGLFGVVNSASVFYRTPLESLSDAQWQDNLAVNLLGPWWVIEAALPHLRVAGGRIVNVVDWAGEKPYTGYLPYVVSKAGLTCLTRALAKELAPGITVNAVAPGPVLPPEEMDLAARERIAARVPLRRWGTPEDVAAAVLFFLAHTDYATGAILHVDGGSVIA